MKVPPRALAGGALAAAGFAQGASLAPVSSCGARGFFALTVAGLCASRMGGYWNRAIPALLLVSSLLGARAGIHRPLLEVLGSWSMLAATAMAGMLIALPRPHSTPSAVVAAALLGFGFGVQQGVNLLGATADSGTNVTIWWDGAVLMAAGVYATGALIGKHIARSSQAHRSFVWVGVFTCLLCGAWIADQVG